MVTAPSVVFQGPLSVADPSAIASLRDFTSATALPACASDALGSPLAVSKSHMRDDLPLYLRRVAAPTPINTLVKLFVLDRSVDAARAAEASAPLDLDDLRDLG